jgi:hypothetical protein
VEGALQWRLRSSPAEIPAFAGMTVLHGPYPHHAPQQGAGALVRKRHPGGGRDLEG